MFIYIFIIDRRSVYSTPPNRPLESDFEDDIVSPSVELKSKNSKIISDVEKESIQAELAGLGEVYQRVCHVSKQVRTNQCDCVIVLLFISDINWQGLKFSPLRTPLVSFSSSISSSLSLSLPLTTSVPLLLSSAKLQSSSR